MSDIIADLEARMVALDNDITRATRRQRRCAEMIDEIRLLQRPVFPSDEHRAGIVVAAERIRAKVEPESHHGDATRSGRVLVDGARGWISVHHGSPYSKRRRGSKIWSFTPEEIDALLELVKAEGFAVADYWTHRDGLSIQVGA